MPRKSKFNKIYEGRWELDHTITLNKKNTSYVFKNIYNGDIITLSHSSMAKVNNGQTTISHIMMWRIKNKKPKEVE